MKKKSDIIAEEPENWHNLFYTVSEVWSIPFSCLRFLQQPKPYGQDWQFFVLTGPKSFTSQIAIANNINTEQHNQWHKQQNVFNQNVQNKFSTR